MTQISFGVTTKLISAFVFATRIVDTGIVQFLVYENRKFQASSSFLCLYRPVCVGPVWKSHYWFSHEAAHTIEMVFRVPLSSHSGVHKYIVFWKYLGLGSLGPMFCKKE